MSEEGYIKGKIALQQSIGLGHKPNAIPPGEARVDADLRLVEIGWHPVAGMGGKWLAEKSGLGKKITASIGKYPDPTQHWAVLVGDFVHQLVSLPLDNSQCSLLILKYSGWMSSWISSTSMKESIVKSGGLLTLARRASQMRPYGKLVGRSHL